MNYARTIGHALQDLLEHDPRVVLLGEDIADPYGGAFKVTKGLSTAFPHWVRTTPISEGAMAGVAAGLALHGHRPILEVMFGDFVTLMFDQIVNHMAKYAEMYDGQVTCPVIVRVPSGGGRGYGPTHSQSLEKHFLGVPHLKVVAASLHHDPADLYAGLLAQDDPALFVEHKLLYPLRPAWDEAGADDGSSDLLVRTLPSATGFPTIALSAVPAEDCTVTVVAYGYQASRAARVVRDLAYDEEVFAELLVPGLLAPMDLEPVLASVDRTGALVTVEEGTAGWSWGSGIAQAVVEARFDRLRRAPAVLTSASAIIPSARRLEDEVLVQPAQVATAVREAA